MRYLNKTKIKKILKSNFFIAAFIVAVFAVSYGFFPDGGVVKKNPKAYAATCLRCTWNTFPSGSPTCASGTCATTCDAHSPSHCTWNCGGTPEGCGDVFCGTATGQNFYNRPVNNRCASPSGASAINYWDDADQWFWTCQSGSGHTISCGAHKIIDGACGVSANTCGTGTWQDAADGATTYNWNCLGVNGGTSAYNCTAPRPINGVCGASLNTCAAGNWQEAADGACTYNWNCLGINGGGNAIGCASAVPAVNGVCSLTHYGCNAGTSANNGTTGVSPNIRYQWNCNGRCGGTTPTCTEADTCRINSVTTTPTSPPTGQGPLTVDFSNHAGTNVASWYRIDFGDGTVVNNPTGAGWIHTYTYAADLDPVTHLYRDNVRQAVLYGRSPLGNECQTLTVNVTVTPPPQCTVNLLPASVTNPNNVTQNFNWTFNIAYGSLGAAFIDDDNGSSFGAAIPTGNRTFSYTARSADVRSNQVSSVYHPFIEAQNSWGNPACGDTSTVTVTIPPGLVCDVVPTSGKSPLVVRVDYYLTGGASGTPVFDMHYGIAPATAISKASGFYYTYTSEPASGSTYTVRGTLSSYPPCQAIIDVKNPKKGEGSEVAP